MKKLSALLAVAVVITSLFVNFVPASAEETVYIPDPVLKATLLQSDTYNTNGDAEMSADEMRAIDYLPLPDLGIKSLEGLQKCTGLRRIDISGNPISDLAPLKDLKYGTGNKCLYEIIASGCDITDLSPIANLGTYYNVNTAAGGPDQTVYPFFDFSNNKIKDISFFNNEVTISGQKRTRLIETLKLSGNQITDISSLKNLTGLKSLDISNNSVSDISVVENLKKLTKFNAANNQITDISKLGQTYAGDADIPAGVLLEELDLSNNKIADFSVISKCTNLELLNISNNTVGNINFVSSLPGLTEFSAASTGITSVAPLASLKNLISIDISGNKVSDITSIAKFMSDDVDFTYIANGNTYAAYAKTKLYKAKTGKSAVTTISKDASLIYLGTAGNRIYVGVKGKAGYIDASATNITFGKALTKKAKSAIVAVKSPTSKAKTKVKFKKNAKITVTSQVGKFYKVKGKTAWVSTSSVK